MSEGDMVEEWYMEGVLFNVGKGMRVGYLHGRRGSEMKEGLLVCLEMGYERIVYVLWRLSEWGGWVVI